MICKHKCYTCIYTTISIGMDDSVLTGLADWTHRLNRKYTLQTTCNTGDTTVKLTTAGTDLPNPEEVEHALSATKRNSTIILFYNVK